MKPAELSSVEACVEQLLEKMGTDLIVAAPLGIGKPNHLLNALWARAKQDSSITLEIFTALSLEIPRGKALLERRFLQAFTRRHFQNDSVTIYPELDYIDDIKRGDVPDNMRVTEFYMQSGKYLSSPLAQRWFTSSNYTHVARDIVNRGVNVLVAVVGCRDDEQNTGNKRYSLGSNPDLAVDLVNRIKDRNRNASEQPNEGFEPHPFTVVAVVNRHMPFMTGEAEVGEEFFDMIIDQPRYEHPLFAVPRKPISTGDYLIGLNASSLIKDGGTLQIGIGSLGDAFVYATMLRHRNAKQYQDVLRQTKIESRFTKEITAIAGPVEKLLSFKHGVYAASEMFTEGFMHLYNAGILKRRVYPDLTVQTLLNQAKISTDISLDTLDALREARAITNCLDQHELDWLISIGVFRPGISLHEDYLLSADGEQVANNLADDSQRPSLARHFLGQVLTGGALLHAAFFLGSKDFYRWLHTLENSERDLFQMTSVSQINELYNAEERDRTQRLHARFINSTMKVSLTGAACSDGLEDHQVVSGVGGQYNFVAMAHALADSRSIIMLRATRQTSKGPVSNIVWQYPYETIPRHLRDIVITEYGIADLRGKSDEDCVKEMLCIADKRFQPALLAQAKRYHKLDPDWEIPEMHCNNTPASLNAMLEPYRGEGLFPEYPFGCDFNPEELQLVQALGWLKSRTGSRIARLKTIFNSLGCTPAPEQIPLLKLMGLDNAESVEERINKKLLMLALQSTSQSTH